MVDIKQAFKLEGASLYLTLLQNVYLVSLIRETSWDFSPYVFTCNYCSGQEHLGFLSAAFVDLRKISLNLSFFICSLEITHLSSQCSKNEMRKYHAWGIMDCQ